MKVAVICEFSGIVRDAFTAQGHDAISYDIIPSERPGRHIQADITKFDMDYWTQFDLAICHPPCTYLANSGVRWLHEYPHRWNLMKESAALFNYVLSLPVDKLCVENPIQHKYAAQLINRKYAQIIHPWQFGHGETKATCLWLKNLPKLQPENIVSERQPKIHYMSPGADRGKERSRTYTGIANAMARQWGA